VVDFGLKQDVNRLEAIVVTGVTGATSQKDLAFAVTKLESADIPVQMPNALAQLQGKVPGAMVVMPSGRPGSNPSINIRGPKMINAEGRSQAPLVIVDGVVTAGNIQDINPDDIESMEVVKGAAGASTFGSRAANGVISITTKSGKNNVGLRYNARTEYGFNDVQSEYPYAQRHMLMMDETNTRFCLRVTGLPACSRTVDFQEEALRINENGPTTNALSPWLLERDYGIGNSPTKPELRGLFLINQWPLRFNPIDQAVTTNPFI
jgi:TonB-dependent SusC/RagA subfamily outer membrane receptor